MRYALDARSLAAPRPSAEALTVQRLFDGGRGSTRLEQRLLGCAAGASVAREERDDELLYVLSGAGSALFADDEVPLSAGLGLFVGSATPWRLHAAVGLELLSVVVRDGRGCPGSFGAVRLAGEARHGATAAREFVLGPGLEQGCGSATQFIGFVPPGRAPDHFHAYDEVLYVLTGAGRLHVEGEAAALAPGSCVHLPARLVHCLENSGSGELELLGVFTPAGSPAVAFYPDGTPAAVPGAEA